MYNYPNNKQVILKKALDYNELLKKSTEQAAKKAKQANDKPFSVAEPSWMSKSTSTFGNGNISSDNFTGLLSSEPHANLKKRENTTPQNHGARIKSAMAKVLSDSTGKDYSRIFDNISDSTVEKNISLADDTVRKNNSKRAYYGDYPNMRDGMALFYAATESGDLKAAKLARQAAYSEGKSENTINSSSFAENTNTTEKQESSWVDVLKDIHNGMKSASDESEDSKKQIKSFDDVLKLYNYFYERIKDNNDFQIKQYLNHAAKTGNFSEEELINLLGSERYVGVSNAKMYFNSNRNSKIISTIPRGTEVTFTGNKEYHGDKEMVEIVYDGNTGWIEADLLKYSERVAKPSNLSTFERFVEEIKDDYSTSFESGLFRTADFINLIVGAVCDVDGKRSTKNYLNNQKIDLYKTGAMRGKYIDDQKYLSEYLYGKKDLSYNGCGVVALYNIFQGLEKPIVFSDLINASENIALINGRFGTSPAGIKNFLSNNGFEVDDSYNVDETEDVMGYDAVIHMYLRKDGTGHYVAGIADSSGKFRFYNSDVKQKYPMTWKEYYDKTLEENKNIGILYSCVYKVRKGD